MTYLNVLEVVFQLGVSLAEKLNFSLDLLAHRLVDLKHAVELQAFELQLLRAAQRVNTVYNTPSRQPW